VVQAVLHPQQPQVRAQRELAHAVGVKVKLVLRKVWWCGVVAAGDGDWAAGVRGVGVEWDNLRVLLATTLQPIWWVPPSLSPAKCLATPVYFFSALPSCPPAK
jgi:hypothetical protein